MPVKRRCRKRAAHWALMLLLTVSLLAQLVAAGSARGESCEKVVQQLNRKLTPKIDAKELVVLLRTLNQNGNRRLPEQFVTKREARRLGWRAGKDLWQVPALKGKSIGGDVFGNREGKLPDGGRAWREADLDYKGGHRGAKRIIFSRDGLRVVTVDHYNSFTEVPACQ